jgi:hypothetical protein
MQTLDTDTSVLDGKQQSGEQGSRRWFVLSIRHSYGSTISAESGCMGASALQNGELHALSFFFPPALGLIFVRNFQTHP